MVHTSAWQHLNCLLLDIYINSMQSSVLKTASTCVLCNPFKGVVFRSVLTSLAFYIFYHIMSIGCTVVLHRERQLIFHSSLVCHHLICMSYCLTSFTWKRRREEYFL